MMITGKIPESNSISSKSDEANGIDAVRLYVAAFAESMLLDHNDINAGQYIMMIDALPFLWVYATILRGGLVAMK